MGKAADIGDKFIAELGLRYSPVGLFYEKTRPAESTGFNGNGGCVVPLIFSAAKGKIIHFDHDSLGWNCSAFYLGYRNWIFPGIENFLSNGSVLNKPGERFIKTSKKAKEFVRSFMPVTIRKDVTVFKPLEICNDKEKPEIVIFFANPDQLSALVFLLQNEDPGNDSIVRTSLSSGCGSVVSLPIRYKASGHNVAVWGMQDISVRKRLPADIMTLSMSYDLLTEIYKNLDQSFIKTDNWQILRSRC